MSLSPGSIALDRFRVLSESGVASGARIWLAEDTGAGGAPAWLLVVPGLSPAQPGPVLDRVQRHALGAAGLRRPLAFGRIDSEGDVVIAYPGGVSVAESLGRGEWFDGARLAKMMRALTRAVAVLHDQGIAHGHLRPDLISETSEGAHVAGFGVAALADALNGAGGAVKALPSVYRAPELLNQETRIQTWADVYALGVIASELLAGRFAVDGEAVSPRVLGAEVSDRVEELIVSALSRTPSARPSDIRAWGEELGQALLASASLRKLQAPAPTISESASDAPHSTEANQAEAELFPTQESHAGSTEPAAPPPPTSQTAPPEHASTPSTVARPSHAPSANHSLRIAVMALALGVLLMVGGVVAVILVARQQRLATAPASSGASPIASGSVAAAPPLPAPTVFVPEPELEESSSPELLGLTPLKPPGAAGAAFAEDAKAPLPVTAREPAWGSRVAPVTIVLFGDLECLHTRRLVRVLERLKVSFGDDVRWVFRHRPLRNHSHAEAAARVFAGIGLSLGHHAFFKALHELAADDTTPTPAELASVLSKASIGVVPDVLAGHPGVLSAIENDVQLAARFDVRGTPTMFINGIRVDGFLAYDRLKSLLLAERRSAIWALASGTPPETLYSVRTNINLIGGDNNEQQIERQCVPIDTSPSIGPENALVTLVEFSDFECPHCKAALPTLQKLRTKYAGKLRLVWKSFPLPQYERALPAVNFAFEARKLGGDPAFFRVHDLLFGSRSQLDDAALEAIALTSGLQAESLLDAAKNSAHAKLIEADIKLGRELNVAGAPVFFVNGRRLTGARPFSEFDALIREELAAAERIVARGLPADRLYDFTCAE